MKAFLHYINSLLDNDILDKQADDSENIDFARIFPFILMHLSVFLVIYCGVSLAAAGLCLFSYLVRMFAITGFYHRYFSHKTFKTNRTVQFIFAFLGCASTQRGPLWWAAHHRKHHKHSDEPADAHSPVAHNFWWSHMGWFLCRKHFPTDKRYVQDWLKFKELELINRYDWFAPVVYALFMYLLGCAAESMFPTIGLNGSQALIWGFFVSTVILYHGTFVINSLAHKWGSSPFETGDSSRNNLWLSVITLGEGWHNNHHFYPNTVRQGFRRYEFDPTYWILRCMQSLGLIHSCRELPAHIKEKL